MTFPVTHCGILVGVDGSPGSNAAVCWAARDAAMRNVSLTLVHASPEPARWPARPVRVGLQQQMVQQAHHILRDAVNLVQDNAQDGAPPVVDTELLASAPAPTLIDLSKEAAMIVVGSSGRDALGRGSVGSVSSALVRHAHCPVVVVGDDDAVMPGHRHGAPVLVGVDGSAVSDLATALAFDEASRRGVDLVALHSWMDIGVFAFPHTDDVPMDSPQEDAVLAERLSGCQEQYPEVTVHRRVVFDKPARRLVELSQSAQLVVVGSHGRGGFAGMMLGSVSTAVLQWARIPVIIARQR